MPYVLGSGECLNESGSSVSFKALQTRIEGAPSGSPITSHTQIECLPVSHTSHNNPLSTDHPIIQSNIIPAKEHGVSHQLDQTFLSPTPKPSSGNNSIKSTKSTKSLKSLLGLNKEAAVENPMVDISVDIGMEASKFDPFGFQIEDEVQGDPITLNIDPEGIH